MTEDQQAEFDKCYAVWPKTRRKRGVAEASWGRRKPPPEFFEWILARNRYCRATNYQDMYRRLFSTAINQRAWVDDIPSLSEAKRQETKKPEYVKPVKRLTREEIDNKYQSEVKPQMENIKRMLK